ncbi:sensor histidine kinase [Planctobacterium marinum]|uniref:sensor histidine kinase n=1 Tax=Planctobacterium marinum TaxID=1631968 RepID=UPI001E5DAD91|nr:ATP-binding protein [Planctobacterium marinum]MCC2604002.1 HAMP domain-containing histidine kinase [Planctobacterium marinum]
MRLNKKKWRQRLSAKVLFAFVLGVVLSIALVVMVILWLSYFHKSSLAILDVSDVATKIGKTIQFNKSGLPVGLDIADGELNWVFSSMPQDVAYRVLDDTGKTQLSMNSLWGSENTTSTTQAGHFFSEHNGISYHNVIASVLNGDATWHIQITVSERFYSFVHTAFALPFMMMGIVVFSIVLFFIFGTCAWVIIGYTLKPLRELSESAIDISPSTLGARLSPDGIPHEILPMVESFNRVLERLEHGFRNQQEFMAQAAHELKTPLALIRAQIELKEQSDERDMLLNDVEHMTRHVQQLLMLAEVSEAQNYKPDSTNVGDVIKEVVVYLQPMINKADVSVNVVQTSTVRWQADSSALFVLIKNLLENAIQHAPKGTAVDICIETSRIAIRDRGPGILNELLPRIFERFWRGEHRRDHGAGLGLAICKEIAQAHGWKITARNIEQGLVFELNNDVIESNE